MTDRRRIVAQHDKLNIPTFFLQPVICTHMTARNSSRANHGDLHQTHSLYLFSLRMRGCPSGTRSRSLASPFTRITPSVSSSGTNGACMLHNTGNSNHIGSPFSSAPASIDAICDTIFFLYLQFHIAGHLSRVSQLLLQQCEELVDLLRCTSYVVTRIAVCKNLLPGQPERGI